MKMNRIGLATVALLLLAALSVSAGDDKWAKMKAELSLTDAQVTQLQQKFDQLQPISDRAKALKSDLTALESVATPDAKAIDAKKAELMALKKDWKAKTDAIYKSVLSKDQFAKYEAMQAQHEKSSQAKKY